MSKLRYLLDTHICIYIAKQKPLSVLRRFEALQVGEVAMSVITFAELLFGVEKSSHTKKSLKILNELTESIPAHPLPLDAAQYYAKSRAHLEKKGHIIGNNNLWIAAHALALGIPVVTNNHHEFARVPALTIENWVDGVTLNNEKDGSTSS